MPDPVLVAASTDCSISVNRFRSNVCLRLRTDEGQGIVDERVLLLHGDGCHADVYQGTSDERGDVRFADLPIRPTQFVYIVLPDVLEAWSAEPVREVWEGAEDALDEPEERGPAIPPTSRGDQRIAGFDNIRSFQNFDKDAVDKLTKVQVVPAGVAAPLDLAELRKLNRKHQQRAAYRRLDLTKYATSTTTSTDSFKTIRVNRLTEQEKYSHHLDAYTLNNAGYTGVSAGKNKYDEQERVWRLKDGAVCNGFINFFLGYWYNLNAAFTVECKNEKFILMMENDGDRNHNRRYRGFAHGVDGALPVPGGVRSLRYKGHRWTAVHNRVPSPPEPHLRFDDPSVLDPQAPAGYRFTHSNDQDPHTNPESVTEQLQTYNVYSKSSDKHRNNDVIMDHHGGLMIVADDGTVETLAADGSKSSSGVYSLTPIVQKSPAAMMASSSVHLRIWPLKTLRVGGYAPSAPVPAAVPAEYKAESSFADEDALDPAFRQSLPRFILWE